MYEFPWYSLYNVFNILQTLAIVLLLIKPSIYGISFSDSVTQTHLCLLSKSFHLLFFFHSKPLVTPSGGHQRSPVLCRRMGSPSVSTAVEMLNPGTRATKDEEEPRLRKEEEEEDDGRSCVKLTWRRGRWWFAEVCGRCLLETVQDLTWLLVAVIYNISTCIRLHPKTSGCCIFVVPLQMHVWRREWVTKQCSHSPPCFFSHAYGASQGMFHCVQPKSLEKQNKTDCPIWTWWSQSAHPMCCVRGLPKEFASVLCASILLLLWMVWEPVMMPFKLSQCCKWLSSIRTWSAV